MFFWKPMVVSASKRRGNKCGSMSAQIKEEGNERCTWLQFLDSPQIRHLKQALSDSATAKKC